MGDFFTGSPYVGGREAEIEKKNEEIQRLQQENKQLRAEMAKMQARINNGGYNGGASNSR